MSDPKAVLLSDFFLSDPPMTGARWESELVSEQLARQQKIQAFIEKRAVAVSKSKVATETHSSKKAPILNDTQLIQITSNQVKIKTQPTSSQLNEAEFLSPPPPYSSRRRTPTSNSEREHVSKIPQEEKEDNHRLQRQKELREAAMTRVRNKKEQEAAEKAMKEMNNKIREEEEIIRSKAMIHESKRIKSLSKVLAPNKIPNILESKSINWRRSD